MLYVFFLDPQKDGGYHPAGSHQHLFSLQLPLHLPTSFEGGDGSVRYSVKGTLDRPWKFNRYCRRYFTVVSPLDLNAMPYLAVSIMTMTMSMTMTMTVTMTMTMTITITMTMSMTMSPIITMPI